MRSLLAIIALLIVSQIASAGPFGLFRGRSAGSCADGSCNVAQATQAAPATPTAPQAVIVQDNARRGLLANLRERRADRPRLLGRCR